MVSWFALVVRLYIKYIRRSKQTFGNAQTMRKSLHNLHLHPQSFNPPTNPGHDITIHREDVNEWPLYRVSPHPPPPGPTPSPSPSRAILYIHGGAFYREIDPYHWKLTIHLARSTGLDVLVPIYPLLPRPTATAHQVVDGLLSICRLTPHTIVNITGDSAGGCLALATTQHLVSTFPALALTLSSLILISPVLDLTLSHPECVRLDHIDPWLGIDGLRVLTPLWAAGTSVTDPIVSPLFGDIEGLPPVLMLSGTHDLLNSDARRLSAKVLGKNGNAGEWVDERDWVGGSVRVEERRFVYVEEGGMIHDYALLPHPEGERARGLIVDFILGNMV
ncbi:unnamed protein product [Periconia digitata]|uniref:Alpha/beta hydrolase fold-3 domain-containing protein n=1 Tax=Periconia digitata TaxID=1303443 RepID=A0A9W4XPU2_9PLEO|nr:unnamed protein product [Periconia digitata]